MKIQRVCESCQGTFDADHWNVARGKARYCSQSCVYVSMSQNYQRKKKPDKKQTK